MELPLTELEFDPLLARDTRSAHHVLFIFSTLMLIPEALALLGAGLSGGLVALMPGISSGLSPSVSILYLSAPPKTSDILIT